MHGVGEECRKGSQEGQMSDVYVLLTHLHCSQRVMQKRNCHLHSTRALSETRVCTFWVREGAKDPQ